MAARRLVLQFYIPRFGWDLQMSARCCARTSNRPRRSERTTSVGPTDLARVIDDHIYHLYTSVGNRCPVERLPPMYAGYGKSGKWAVTERLPLLITNWWLCWAGPEELLAAACLRCPVERLRGSYRRRPSVPVRTMVAAEAVSELISDIHAHVCWSWEPREAAAYGALT